MNDRIEAALAALPKSTPGPRTGLVAQNTADYVLALAAPDLAAEVIRLREEVARLEKSPALRPSMLVEARDKFAASCDEPKEAKP